MAITDINISEELQTNAPSIKYRGNEGPKSPQQQEQALLMRQLRAEYERYVAQANPSNVLSFEDWYRMSIEQQAQTRGPRAMAAYGGIMGVDGRRQYGFGSSLKSFVRKVIPNEVSKVATVAAPFVAPFNPALAAGMAGIGSFDQSGSISDAFKSGALTYGLGQGARYLGGADFQKLQNPFTKDAFSKPIGTGGIKDLFKSKVPTVPEVTADNIANPEASIIEKLKTGALDERYAQGGADVFESGVGIENAKKASEGLQLTNTMKKISKYALDPKTVLGIIGLGGAAAMGAGMGTEEESLTEVDRGPGLTGEIPSGILSIRKEVIEAFKDPSGEALEALRIKYPFLGKKEDKNLAEGGRIGYANGVGPVLDVQEDDLSITDFMQDQGIPQGQMASMPSTFSELNQLSIDLFGRPYDKLNDSEQEILIEYFTKGKKQGREGVMAAQGGRIGFSEGTPSKRDELVERFGVGSDLLKKVYPLFMDEDGDYRKALQIAKYKLGEFISGKGTDLDTGAEWYNKLDKDTQKEILEEKIKIREERPEMYKKFDIKPSYQMIEEMEMPVYDEEYAGKYGIGGRYAQGGRIGKAFGGIMDLGGKEKDYRNTGGFVDLGAKEKADDVPARLSVNEFVMTADAVRGMGNGDIDLGAQRMENLMGHMENKGKQGAQEMFNVSERLSEVV